MLLILVVIVIGELYSRTVQLVRLSKYSIGSIVVFGDFNTGISTVRHNRETNPNLLEKLISFYSSPLSLNLRHLLLTSLKTKGDNISRKRKKD